MGAVAGAIVALAISSAPVAATPARVFAVDDEVRLRRGDSAGTRTWGRPLAVTGGAVDLVAFRGETVAFQIAVQAGDAPVRAIAISITGLSRAGLAGPDRPGDANPRAVIFREHYLPVRTRSRNDRRPTESLGWLPAARLADDVALGEVPDALLPIDLDPRPVMAASSDGADAPAGQTGTFWIDVEVPEDAAAGAYLATAEVTGDGVALARFRLQLQVAAPLLPYRATSVFVFYEAERLERRIGSAGAVERQLWRLLHAHHIDALAPLAGAADVRRLTAAYDGSLFAASPPSPDDGAAGHEAAYEGPGRGVPPAVVALGAYGALGAPRPDSLRRVEEMLAALPGIADVFVYAIDETCASPRAGEWRQALAGRATPRPLLVGQTCNDPPERQAVDIAMATAESFPRGQPGAARAAGRRAWIYNGILPYTGTLLLDADPRGLIANGWIAAVMDIERWFYWESTFWDDDNRGGHGPIDPFSTAEGFHNGDGDAALGDGLLLYPGRQRGRFAARSLGYPGVLPSLRLKQLRRGIEDAGIIALAARERPEETARIVAQALPAALDEAATDRPAAWQGAPLRFVDARAALRALVTRAQPMTAAEIGAALADQAARRRGLVPLATAPRGLMRRRMAGPIGLAILVVLVAVLGLVARWMLRWVPRAKGP